MAKKLTQALCLFLTLMLVLAVIGCAPKASVSNTSSNNNQSNTTSSDESDDTEEDFSDLEDDEYDDEYEDDYDDFEDWEDGEYEDQDQDEEYEEEEEIYYEELKIYNKSEPVNKNFLGINGVHLLFEYMPDPYGDRNLNEKEVTTLYDRFEKMGVNQIRTFYASAVAWDFETDSFNWNVTDNSKKINQNLKGLYRSLRELDQRNMDVALAAHWNLSSLIDQKAESNDFGENPVTFYAHGIYVKGDFDATIKNYESFMEKSILNLEANGIKNVTHLMAFTECNNTFGYDLETRKYDELYPIFDKAITALDKALKDIGRRDAYKIVGPCDNFRGDFEQTSPESYSLLSEYAVKNLSDKIDIIGAHSGYARSKNYTDDLYYDLPSLTMATTYEIAKKGGKDFWIDEYNVVTTDVSGANGLDYKRIRLNDPAAGVAMGAMVSGVMNMGVSNMFIWALSNNQWPSSSTSTDFENGMHITTGLQPALQESAIPYNPWYSASLLTKYIGKGTVYSCDTGIGIYMSAIERKDGNITVIVTNYDVLEMNINIKFEGALANKTFYRHNYTVNDVLPTPNADIIPASKKIINVTTDILDVIPGFSVAVYTTVSE